MFKFLTQGHKIMKIRSGIIALAPLAVLAAVITPLALSSFTAEAQGNPGAIANLQLTSTTAGTLTVSWDAASPRTHRLPHRLGQVRRGLQVMEG